MRLNHDTKWYYRVMSILDVVIMVIGITGWVGVGVLWMDRAHMMDELEMVRAQKVRVVEVCGGHKFNYELGEPGTEELTRFREETDKSKRSAWWDEANQYAPEEEGGDLDGYDDGIRW